MEISTDKTSPILVFDSGAGGISVLRELVKQLPCEDFIFFGDSANAPYGTKDMDTVRQLTISHVERYLERGVKAVCVACNTATSAAVAALRRMYPELPLVGIEPAIKPAAEAYPGGNIIVLATPMTVALPKFNGLLERYKDVAHITPVAAPGLMEFVERGEITGPALESFLTDLVAPYKGNVDGAVLGCTHYPFIAPVLKKVLGDVSIFDGSEGTARQMRRSLEAAGLLNDAGLHNADGPHCSSTPAGRITYECSSPDPDHIKVFEKLFNI